ncbi:DeoR/GlpR family DNA-binding transcription regulator [Loigolactobacillus iwatensis]|uniref:DeoR/GlpR family DNA-binding transcription regulator n=1 Tax=Loigolactobacillus iwatensis TaxID=1267156 RepID=UPI000F7D7944|nr:DeoR/GlpR family DNA-binding transcription regulator [Loigolactobacillus iwatensis]
MNPYQRQALVLSKVKEYSFAKISQLSSELNVTRETIRKDLYTLESKGLLKTVRGGATTISLDKETKYDKRLQQNSQDKLLVAKKAIEFIQSGNSVFLDYGTTTFSISQAIKQSDLHDLTLITNSLAIATNLIGDSANQIILLGGNLRQSESSLSGPLTLQAINDIYADIGFFGCGGINIDIGITNHYLDEVEVSKRVMKHCQKIIAVADSNKFQLTALYKTADFSEISAIITDNKISPELVTEFQHSGIDIEH